MSSSAAAMVHYQRVFGEDLLASIVGSPSEAEATKIFTRLGYIYAKAAEGADMKALSLDGYAEWLDAFEMADILEAVGEIGELYTASAKGSIAPK